MNNEIFKYHFKYTTRYIVGQFSYSIILIILSFYLYEEIHPTLGIVQGVIAAALFIINLPLIKNKSVIKVSKKGIWTKPTKFIEWNKIKHISIDEKSFRTYLSRHYNEHLLIFLKNSTHKNQTLSIIINGTEKRDKLKIIVKKHLDHQ